MDTVGSFQKAAEAYGLRQPQAESPPRKKPRRSSAFVAAAFFSQKRRVAPEARCAYSASELSSEATRSRAADGACERRRADRRFRIYGYVGGCRRSRR